jgi:DNA-binding winged helix-turn-helix (wHTH) protein/TolB-like protein/Tfp pilus assembly protein PilF
MFKRSTHLYEFGPFQLDVAERLFLKDAEPVALTPKAFEMLVVLVERSGHLVEKDELLKEVWRDQFVEESNLSQNIYLLRKALGDGANEHQYIETVPRRGYRFVADVREVRAAARGDEMDETDIVLEKRTSARILIEEEGSDEEGSDAAGGIRERDVPALHAPASAARRRLSRTSLALLILCVCAIAASLLYFWTMKAASPAAGKTPLAGSIAVLPFKPLGAESGDELLGLGMADATIIKLSNLQQLPVLPTSAIFKYTGREHDPVASGRELGVETVLDGTVQHSDDRVRVTVQLISLRENRTLWSGKFDEQFTNIFAVQDSISEQVAQALALQLTADERKHLSKRYTENTEAYQSYLMGLYFWNKRTKDGLHKAIEYFQQAIARDASYALAYAGLADAYHLSVYYGYETSSPAEVYRKAQAAATRALALDDTLAEAHTAMAMIQANYERDAAASEKSLKRAISLNPGYATAHQRYAWVLLAGGRADEAIQEMRRALSFDPVSLTINAALGSMFNFARRYDEAIQQLQRTLLMDPNFSLARYNLGLAFEHKGMYEEAIAEFKRAGELDPDTTDALEALGYVYAVTGRRTEARKVLAELQEMMQRREVSRYNLALIYAALGEKDRAFEWLERAAADKSLQTIYLRFDPQLDILKADPRFKDFLRRHDLSYLVPSNQTS